MSRSPAQGGGGRNNALNRAAFAIGQLVAGGQVAAADAVANLFAAACAAGLDDDREGGPEKIRDVIRRAMEAGGREPRAPKAKADPVPVLEAAALVEAAKAGGKRLTVSLSAVRPRAVEWLVPNRIPKRFITVFAGRTGIGKSFVSCDIIARLSAGGEIPGGGGELFTPGGTLILSEDSHEYVLAPRLISLGADLSRVNAMTWEAMAKFHLGDTAMLEAACNEVPGGVSLVMIDPPTNFLLDTDEHKNSEVRQLVMKVVEWCFGRDLACLFVLHVNKQTGAGVEAINRVMGSVAWVSTARIAHSFSLDPDDPTRGLWVPTKNNLGPLAKGLAYRIEAAPAGPRVEWLGEVDTTADEALGGTPRKERQDIKASRWLVDRFRERQEWESDELFKAAHQEGLSRNAVFGAKNLLDLPRARRRVQQNGDTVYLWWVPPDWPQLAEETERDSRTVGQ
jgi:hypothetical protein